MLSGTVIVVLVRPLPAPPWLASIVTWTLCAVASAAAASAVREVLANMIDVDESLKEFSYVCQDRDC